MTTQTEMTPAEFIMAQIATIDEAIARMRAAIDDATGSIDPDSATWADTARLAQICDAIKRMEG